MEYEINDKVLSGFNDILATRYSILRLKRGTSQYAIDIVTVDDPLIDEDMRKVYPNSTFYDLLGNYFAKNNIPIKFNNTAATFWKRSVK